MRARITPIVVICALLVGFAQPAGADTPQEKLERAQTRLHDLTADLEIQIEECNTRREQYKAAQQAVKDNRSDHDEVEAALASVDSQRGDVVAEMYKQSTSTAQVETLTSTATSLTEYAERLTWLDITAKARTSAFERFAAAQEQLAASAEMLELAESQAREANTEAQRSCEETERRVEAEEARVSDLAAEVERLEEAARSRQEDARSRQEDAADDAAGAGDSGSTSTPKVSGNAAGAVEFALAQVGKPYVWGGAGPDSYDCSGLTSAAWAAAGTSLPHSSQMQYSATARVSRDAAQPGDLLFHGSPIHHVAMYIGNGKMVEAPHSGALVRVVPADRSDLAGVGRP
jgi:cell wall-associated NlpC family hydrolase